MNTEADSLRKETRIAHSVVSGCGWEVKSLRRKRRGGARSKDRSGRNTVKSAGEPFKWASQRG